MRTRSNVDAVLIAPGGNYSYVDGSGTHVPDPPSYHATPAGYLLLAESEMTDDPTGGKGHRTKPCIHRKTIRTELPLNTYTWYPRSNPAGGSTYHGNRVYWNAIEGWGSNPLDGNTFRLESLNYVYPKSRGQFVADCWAKFYNENEVNNVLNIVESSDLNPHMGEVLKKIQNLDPTDFRSLKDRKGNTSFSRASARGGRIVRGLADVVSNLYLYKSFAVAPLVSDMKKLARSVTSIQEDMAKSNDRAGKVEVLRFKMKGQVLTPTTGNWDRTSATRGYRWLTLSGDRQCVQHVTIKGIRKVAYSGSTFKKLDYLMRKFGAAGPASYAWERIPFSFVSDWFVDLRSITNGLDNILTGGSKVVVDASWSEILEATISCVHADEHTPYVVSNVVDQEVSSKYERSFTRLPLEPGFSPRIESHFGKEQSKISIALATQLVAKWLGSARR
jgi:hypothetical protein